MMKLIPSSVRKREDGITIQELNQHATRLNVPDRNSVYDKAGAERHWKRLLPFFAETLKS
jgi:dienelactone hydrolase